MKKAMKLKASLKVIGILMAACVGLVVGFRLLKSPTQNGANPVPSVDIPELTPERKNVINNFVLNEFKPSAGYQYLKKFESIRANVRATAHQLLHDQISAENPDIIKRRAEELAAFKYELLVLKEELTKGGSVKRVNSSSQFVRQIAEMIKNVDVAYNAYITKNGEGATEALEHLEQTPSASPTIRFDKLGGRTRSIPPQKGPPPQPQAGALVLRNLVVLTVMSLVAETHATEVLPCQQTFFDDPNLPDGSGSQFLNYNRPEFDLTPDLIANAQGLRNTYDIYKFVQTQVRYENYFGAVQSAHSTYLRKSGNPADKATLLIGMLRAAGIPSRYVFGDVLVSEVQLMKLWKVESYLSVYNIHVLQLPNLEYLRGTSRWMRVGNQNYYMLPHVWVEAYSPLNAQRGNGLATGIKSWIPLDPSSDSFNVVAHSATDQGINSIASSNNLNLFSATDYLLSPDPSTGKILKQAAADEIYVQNTVTALNIGLSQNTSWAVPFSSLANQGDLYPYQPEGATIGPNGAEACIHQKEAYLPAEQKVSLLVQIDGLSATVAATDIGLKSLYIAYAGVTTADQNNLNAIASGKSVTAAINVIPKLYADDQLIASGTSAIFGTPTSVNLKLVQIPEASQGSHKALVTTGQTVAITSTWRQNSAQHVNDVLTTLTSLLESQNNSVLSYFEKSRLTGKVLSAAELVLLQKAETTMGNIAAASNTIGLTDFDFVTMAAGLAPVSTNDRMLGFVPQRPKLDWDDPRMFLTRNASVALGNASQNYWTSDASQLRALAAESVAFSSLEHRIFEDFFSIPGQSTVKVIQEAGDAKARVVNAVVTPSNLNSVLGSLSGYSAGSISAFRDAINEEGMPGRFIAPASPFSIAGRTFEVAHYGREDAFGWFNIIGGNLGGYGGDPAPDTLTGYTSTQAPQQLSADESATPTGGATTWANLANQPNSTNGSLIDNNLASGASQVCNPGTSVGCPVELSTGSMWHGFTDFPQIPGPGLALGLIRTYLAQSNYSGPLGYGWTHNYNMRLVAADGSALNFSQSQNLNYFDEKNGSSLIVFANGQAVTPPWMKMKLFKISKGPLSPGYQVVFADNTVYNFYGSGTAIGRIRSITDIKGNAMGFTYSTTAGRPPNLLTVTDSIGRAMSFSYDPNNRITSITDFSGRTTSYTYDSRGDLASSKDLNGNVTTYSYLHDQVIPSLNHNLASFREPNGSGVDFYYYANDKLFKHIEAGGRQTTYIYNSFSNQTSVVDGVGNKTVYNYDMLGNLVKITNPDGTFKLRSYDLFKNLVQEQDEDGFITKYQSDARGNTIKITPQAPLGPTTIVYHSIFNIPISVTDGNGNVTQYKLDDTNGNVLSETRYLDSAKTQPIVKTFTYYPDGEIQTATDAKGGVTQFARTFDASFRETVAITNPLNGHATKKFDGLGRLVSDIDFNGKQINSTYDNFGRLLSAATVGSPVSTLLTYDQVGHLLSEQRKSGSQTLSVQRTYNLAGDVTSKTDELGLMTTYSDVDPNCNCSIPGRVYSLTDPKGNRTATDYDFRGQPIRITDGRGAVTTISYDNRGNRSGLSVTDANGNQLSNTTSTFGPLNLPLKTVDNMGMTGVSLFRNYYKQASSTNGIVSIPATTIFNYDGVGNLVQRSISGGSAFGATAPKSISYSYNAVNLLTSKVFKEGSTPTVTNTFSYSYDKNLNMVSGQNGQSIISQTFDALNRPVSVTTTSNLANGITQPNSVVNYAYDGIGQVTSVSDSSNQPVVKYGFDNLFRLNSVQASGSTVALGYDSFERRNSIAYPNGLTTSIAFTSSNQVASISTQNLSSLSFSYDSGGNITQITSDRGQVSYRYDQTNWLIQTSYKGQDSIPSENFVWDSAGNPASGKPVNSGSISAGSAIRPLIVGNQLFEDSQPTTDIYGSGLLAYRYDLNGNVIERYNNQTDEHVLYTYDPENHLVQVQSVSLSGVVLSQTNYKYDVFGRRIGKQSTQGGNTTRLDYIYDRDNILFEYDANGIRHAIYVGTGEIDNHLMMIRDGTTHFYHTDQIGSVVALTDASGQVEEQVSYSAFGKLSTLSLGASRTPASVASAIVNPYYFAGREFDQETGLYFNRARYFDPNSGRFVSLDPARYTSGDANFYRYTVNNPLIGTDPNGLWYAGISLGGYASGSVIVGTFTGEKGTYTGYSSNGGATATPYTAMTSGLGLGVGASAGGTAAINLGWGDNPSGNSYGLSVSIPVIGSFTATISSSGISVGYANGPGFQPYAVAVAGNTQLANVPGTPNPYQPKASASDKAPCPQ